MSIFKKEEEKIGLVVMPDERLRKVCEPVTKFDAKLQQFVEQLATIMFTQLPWGIPAGLAAPQVGKNIRLFVVNEGLGKDRKSGDFGLFINPVVVWETRAPKDTQNEGCFSLEKEKMDYPVPRVTSIRVRWQDMTGGFHDERFNGMRARVMLHEIDHLDGKLVCDYQEK